MNYTTKVYKQSRMLEIMIIDDPDLTLLFNGMVQEYGEEGFCEFYKAAKLIMDGELDSYSLFHGSYGVNISEFKAVLWLDGMDGDKCAKEISISMLCNLLEIYRREWLKNFEEDPTLRTYGYTPFIEGIITDDDYLY